MSVARLALVLGLSLSSAAAHAACDLSMALSDCEAAVEAELAKAGVDIISPQPSIEDTKTVVINGAPDVLNRFNTGLSSALANGELTNLEDFLPKLNFFALGGGEEADAVVFEVNQFLGLPTDDGYKLSVKLLQAEVFDPLLMAIPEAQRANLRDEFEDQLSDFDDVQFSFVYSPMTPKWGRSDHQFAGDIFDAVLEDTDTSFRDAMLAANLGYAQALNALTAELFVGDDDNTVDAHLGRVGARLAASEGGCRQQVAASGALDAALARDLDAVTGHDLVCLLAASRQETGRSADLSPVSGSEMAARNAEAQALVQGYLDAYAALIRAAYVELQQHIAQLEDAGFFVIPDLINNQPQLNLTIDYRDRDTLVGQDEFSFKLTYEKGFININGLRSFDEASCDGIGMNDCLGAYMTEERRSAMQRGDRLAFSAAFSRRQAYSRTFDPAMAAFELPSEESLLASLSYGRYVRFGDNERGATRVEFSASYEDVDGDTMRQDRLFATTTFSQQITDEAALSFSLVYANKPEYRGEVGTELSARLGINYKLFDPKKDKP